MGQTRNNPYQIQIKTEKLGKDYTFLITGGTAHIGAIAVAYYDSAGRIIVEGNQVPDHREGPLAKEVALAAAEKLHTTVSVVMGIHIDQATKEMIEDIVDYVKWAMTAELQKLCGQQSSGL